MKEQLRSSNMVAPSGETIARELHAIHTHAEIANLENPEQIVYREKDVIALLL